MAKERMKGPEQPSERWEDRESPVEVSNLKYAGEFSNPEDLKRSTDALASYVKKNRMKY